MVQKERRENDEGIHTYACPHCNSPSFYKNGKENGVQRYMCKKCNKTFRHTTGTSIHQMHKKKLIDKYFKVMQKGLSIRKAAIEVGISKNTSFAWRHKFLASMTKSIKAEGVGKETGSGMKIIRLPYSKKGRRKPPEKWTNKSVNLLVASESNVFIIKLAPANPVKNACELLAGRNLNKYVANIPNKTLSSALKKSNKICLARRTDAFKNLQNKVELKEGKLSDWMSRFNGVATKYLQHYWSWFAIIENINTTIHPQQALKRQCVTPRSRADYFFIRDL